MASSSPPSNIVSFLAGGTAILLVSGSSVQVGSSNQAIIASTDGGLTWTARTTPINQTVHMMAHSASRAEILAMDNIASILRSTDGGITWSSLANDLGGDTWGDLIRREDLGLYIASGGDTGNPTLRIATSPDGVTWTRRTTPNRNFVKLLTTNSGSILAGSTSSVTQPTAISVDGAITWSLVASQGLARSSNELAQSSGGRYMIGTTGEVSTLESPDLLTFNVIGGLGAGQQGLGYDAELDLFATSVGGGAFGVGTCPGTGAAAWTQRNAAEDYNNIRDIISMQDAPGFIGIRPTSGAIVTHRIVRSTDGIVWTNIAPAAFNINAAYNRIYEFFV
jgi:hypothetical protein